MNKNELKIETINKSRLKPVEIGTDLANVKTVEIRGGFLRMVICGTCVGVVVKFW